jgi:hypothetical protein
MENLYIEQRTFVSYTGNALYPGNSLYPGTGDSTGRPLRGPAPTRASLAPRGTRTSPRNLYIGVPFTIFMPETNIRITSADGTMVGHFRQNHEMSALVFYHVPTDTHCTVEIPRNRTTELMRAMENTCLQHGAKMSMTC